MKWIMVLLLCATPLMLASPKKATIKFNPDKAFSTLDHEAVLKALRYYGVHHPDIVYAQAILETGHFKSKVCKDCNNLFGLYDSRNKRYYKFDKWYYSIKAYKTMIQSKYKPPNNYYKFLDDLGYAEDPNYISKLKNIVKRNDKGRSS